MILRWQNCCGWQVWEMMTIGNMFLFFRWSLSWFLWLLEASKLWWHICLHLTWLEGHNLITQNRFFPISKSYNYYHLLSWYKSHCWARTFFTKWVKLTYHTTLVRRDVILRFPAPPFVVCLLYPLIAFYNIHRQER